MLRERVRDVDRIARWGGEEFILLLPETDAEGAANLASKLCQSIADNVFEYEGRRLSITLTLGVAAYRKGDSLDACIARADKALYRGKEEGRNTVAVSEPGGLSLVN
jgi:diguanylate cyclase (GGDEF)-like protein